MKKLNLKAAAFEKGEVLTRSQLKKVLGGDSPSTVATCSASCSCPEGKRLKSWLSGWSVSVNCTGGCSAEDGVGVTCGTYTSSCSDNVDTYCETIPTTTA